MRHTPTERLEPCKIWCGENDKQRHKHIRPVKRLCECDKFGNANWGNRNIGLSNASADPEVDHEKTSRQRIKARISTSTKLPGIDRVTPTLVRPLVENGASIEEAFNNIVGSIGEQNEHMSIRMSELERAVHVERESLREEINRNRQEVGRGEKRLKEITGDHIAKNLLRMTREAEQRELRLRDDMEKLRTQQEQTLGTLDTKIDAMM